MFVLLVIASSLCHRHVASIHRIGCLTDGGRATECLVSFDLLKVSSCETSYFHKQLWSFRSVFMLPGFLLFTFIVI